MSRLPGKKLTKKSGDNVDQWGAMIPSTGYPYWMFGALAMQNDQTLMNGDGNETYFDSPATVEALNFGKPRVGPWNHAGRHHRVGHASAELSEGKTAIMWHSTGNLTTVKNNASFDFGVAMLLQKAPWHTDRWRQLLHF